MQITAALPWRSLENGLCCLLICCFLYDAYRTPNVAPQSGATSIVLRSPKPPNATSDATRRLQNTSNSWFSGKRADAKGPSFVVDYKSEQFLKDGEPFRIVAGVVHYFRVVKDSWRDRMLKMKAAGLNAVHVFVEWSGHEPQQGRFNFEDHYDLETFLETARQLGLLALVCVGPYVGVDRDNGGLPFWLLTKTSDARTSDKRFTSAVESWFRVLLPKLKPFAYHNGGPVVAVQVENKYGDSYACDVNYGRFLVGTIKRGLGESTVLFTTDSPFESAIRCGKMDGALTALDLVPGANVSIAFKALRKAVKRGPFFVAAFHVGVPHRWGRPPVKTNVSLVLKTMREILVRRASISLHVFHGGTNFGFGNGADELPITTTYDYGAPLSEAGDATPLFFRIRDEFVNRDTLLSLISQEPKLHLGKVQLKCGLLPKEIMEHFRKKNALVRVIGGEPVSFEDLRHFSGYVLYKSKVNFTTTSPASLRGLRIRDRGYIYTRTTRMVMGPNVFQAPIVVGKEDIAIVVENTGRLSTGAGLGRMGLLAPVTLDGVVLENWTTEAVPLNDPKNIADIEGILTVKTQGCQAPAVFFGRFSLPERTGPGDTFLDLTGWTKGVAFLNGFNLGRYWPAVGPQRRLYVPGSLLLQHPNQNLIMLFEMEAVNRVDLAVHLLDQPGLD